MLRHGEGDEVVTRTVPGDRALACRHVEPDDLGDLYLIALKEGTVVLAAPEHGPVDALAGEVAAQWIFLCPQCYRWWNVGAGAGLNPLDLASQDFTVDRVIEATQRRTDG